MPDLEPLLAAVLARVSQPRAVLAGLSGIDGSGKGYVAVQARNRLESAGLRVALLNVDGWLNLPSVRFSRHRPAEHFYHHALRLDAMFRDLVLPLRQRKRLRLEAQLVEETATEYHPHLYDFGRADVVLVEGIFIYKRAYRPHFDVAFWIDCTFDTALERALARSQEGLPPAETVAAYQTIYFPAQRLHLERDDPRGTADGIIRNDARLTPPQ